MNLPPALRSGTKSGSPLPVNRRSAPSLVLNVTSSELAPAANATLRSTAPRGSTMSLVSFSTTTRFGGSAAAGWLYAAGGGAGAGAFAGAGAGAGAFAAAGAAAGAAGAGAAAAGGARRRRARAAALLQRRRRRRGGGRRRGTARRPRAPR